MKIAVLADIHGNLPALNAVLAEIEDEVVNQILVAGDILGGPYPVEVIRILILFIRFYYTLRFNIKTIIYKKIKI